MRTKIAATWIVAHERGTHALLRDGELVFEGNRIIHVGRGFDGHVDRTIDAAGKLIAPGFIDTHVHSGHRASHRLITAAEISIIRCPLLRFQFKLSSRLLLCRNRAEP